MSSSNSLGYKKLVRLMARAFYAGDCPPKFVDLGDEDGGGGAAGGTAGGSVPGRPKPKPPSQVDTNNLGVVVLDALTR